MFRNRGFALATVLLVSTFSPMSATATTIGTSLDGEIDFRTAPYRACRNLLTCAVGNIEFSASSNAGPAPIFQDSRDGLGVRGGQETDEIDGINEEQLSLVFTMPELLAGVWFTDLFSGGNDPLEVANTTITLVDGSVRVFQTTGLPQSVSPNGEVFLDFGVALLVSLIDFGTPSVANDDHSVAGLVRAGDVTTSVPEGSHFALIGLGMLLLVALRSRKRT